MRRPGGPWLRLTLIAAAVCVLLALAALFAAPRLIQVPSVKTELEQQISKMVSGRVTWKSLDLRLLPRPHGLVRDIEIDIPGTLRGRIDTAEVRLQLSSLLHGRAVITAVDVTRPTLELRLAALPANPTGAPFDPVAAYRSAMEPVARAIPSFGPDMAIALDDGRVTILADGAPRIELTNLSLRGRTGGSDVTVKISTAGNFWRLLQLDARSNLSDLRGQVTVDVSDFKPQVLLDTAISQPLQLTVPIASLHAEARTDGRSVLDAGFTAETPSVRVARKNGHLDFAGVLVKGTAVSRGQQTELALTEVRLGDIVPAATATLRSQSPPGAVELAIQVPALDLVKLRDAALALAGDDPDVHEYAPRVHAGAITDLQVAANAPTLENLFELQHLAAKLNLVQVSAKIPALEREATALSAQAELRDGRITATSVSSKLGDDRVSEGSVTYALASGDVSASSRFDVDLKQTLELVREQIDKEDRAALAPIRALTGRARGHAQFALKGEQWNAAIAVAQSDSSLESDWLPWSIAVKAGNVAFSAERLTLDSVRGSVGATAVSDGAAAFDYAGPFTIRSASGKVTPALAEVYSWLQSRQDLSKVLQPIKSVTGQAEVILKRFSGKPDDPATLVYEATIEPRDVQVQLADLPAPIALAGGAIEVSPSAIVPKDVVVSLLDAHAKVSAKVSEYTGKDLKADGALSDGVMGAKLVRWFWAREHLPLRVEPKAPIRFAASRVRANLKPSVEVQLSAQFDSGPNVGVNLAWDPDILNVKRLTIKDKRTDAVYSLLMGRRMIDASFTGSMYGPTIDAMLSDTTQHIGHGSGDMRVIFDRDHPEQTTGTGHLVGDNLNLTWLVGKPVTVGRIELEADASVLRIGEAVVRWAEQPATIRGNVKHDGNGLVIDAQVESEGIVIDALLPAGGPEGEVENPRTLDAKSLGWLWPLPVTGSVSVHAGFIQWRRYQIAPVQGTLTLERERAHLDVKEAQLCGVSFPFAVELTPEGGAASAHVAAQDLGFQKTARCLTGERLLLSGRYDLKSDMVTSGANATELIDKLQGKVELQARNGKVMKFALLGNILRMKNIAGLFKNGAPKLDDKGFPYKTLTLGGHFDGGRFVVDQSSFDSDAVGLVATGSVGLRDGDSKLTVLVAPFGSLDRLVRKVPLIGYIVGGTFTSVPVSVSGDIRDPAVVPLGARAVGAELLGVVQRTLKLPVKVLDLSGAPAGAPAAAK